MAKSKNHTSHNQSNKAHKNGAPASELQTAAMLDAAALAKPLACTSRWCRTPHAMPVAERLGFPTSCSPRPHATATGVRRTRSPPLLPVLPPPPV